MRCIAYNDGYKYQLKETYAVVIEIKPASLIQSDYIDLDTSGQLTIRKGYAWDGPSGPTIDTPSFMRGSLVHDALYQLMRDEYLDRNVHRGTADLILKRICLEDGMWPARAWWVYEAVKRFADPASDPASKRPPIKAPEGCDP
ncbi:hypothetical protein ACQE3E_17550 [Methylomonas sp. MED-D]|uniref:hypothetical protein n=1 Tax=unclassified Methylomonas TaxID=2608980 RepID=UPI0028A49C45|nr:hypothetical protein [Methylomonas sp. MV1]MDT4330839.1 hypothetical protein [Methylomonas sp. MV1]